MFLVRDIMYCKPGKARPMVEKFVTLAGLSEKKGPGTKRVDLPGSYGGTTWCSGSCSRGWTQVGKEEGVCGAIGSVL